MERMSTVWLNMFADKMLVSKPVFAERARATVLALTSLTFEPRNPF